MNASEDPYSSPTSDRRVKLMLPFFSYFQVPSSPVAPPPNGMWLWQESCAFKAASGVLLGGGVGAAMGIFFGVLSSDPSSLVGPGGRTVPPAPLSEQMATAWRGLGEKAVWYMKSFAVITALFSGFDCLFEKARGKHDVLNGGLSGCASGALLAVKQAILLKRSKREMSTGGFVMMEYAVMGGLVGTLYVATSGLLRWSQRRAHKQQLEDGKAAGSEHTPEFVRFQRDYVAVFLLGLGCEYVQAAMAFALMRHEHAWSFTKIAQVYALGFAASWATSACFSSEQTGGACVGCLVSYGAAAIMAAKAEGPRAMAGSRVVAGIAQTLLQSAFDAWMRAAHADLGFPAAWRRSTYELAGAGTTFVSIGSGALAEGVRRATESDRRPFELSFVFAAIGCGIILLRWPKVARQQKTSYCLACDGENRFSTLISCTGKTTKAFAAGLAACVFEATAYVTNATWATALARVEHAGRSPYGFVFALLMSCAVSGTHLFQLTASRAGVEKVATFLSVLAGLAFAILALVEAKTGVPIPSVLLPLFLFQLCAGWSVPVFATVRGKHVPSDLRRPLARVSTALHGVVVIALILLIPADTQLTFAICATLMLAALLASLRLLLAP
ncbi:hypothetical protein CTAYLR_000268 [Chrysophaeum taylorii]|uniref:Molybdate-anion transporter n=1 Tax=Chrysophaeum taylorii TaxID=2483200 RepID=A0AAD7XMD0_9STRA|nr:hypothetical protein CTAYLR_000268 [Chrysophaeum taylorii]